MFYVVLRTELFLNVKGYFLIVKGQMDKGPNDGLSGCKQLMHAICDSSLLYESIFELSKTD